MQTTTTTFSTHNATTYACAHVKQAHRRFLRWNNTHFVAEMTLYRYIGVILSDQFVVIRRTASSNNTLSAILPNLRLSQIDINLHHNFSDLNIAFIIMRLITWRPLYIFVLGDPTRSNDLSHHRSGFFYHSCTVFWTISSQTYVS